MSRGGTSAADERRLKPIFDLVDDGNYKQAVSMVDKVLKKSPNFVQAKALKALCLWRCEGKQSEALELVDAIVADPPDDEATLSLLSLTLRDMKKDEQVASIYSKAVEKHPKDEELLCSLFMAHVRLSDFKQQQARAVQLNKVCPNKPYYFWSVMSLVLQAKADPGMGVKMHLPLARRMLEKSLKDQGAKPEMMELLLLVLEEQSDFAEAFRLCEEHPSAFERELPAMQQKRKISYLLKLERHREICDVCKETIAANPDADWTFFQSLITSAIEISQKDGEGQQVNGNCDQSLLDDVISFLLKNKEDNSRSIAPCFSLIFFKYRLMKLKMVSEKLPPLEELIDDFFTSFGRKSCFFAYVKHCLPFSKKFPPSDLSEAIAGLEEETPTLDGLYRLQSTCELHRYATSSEPVDVEVNLKRCNILRSLYEKYFSLGAELKPTEPQFADKFMLLAVHFLLDCYVKSGDQKYLWLAIEHLEAARLKSPHDGQILISLLRLYDHLGLFQPCTILYDQLQIKQFLHHSMGHVISTNLHHYGALAEASSLFEGVLKYFSNSSSTIPDYVVSAFRNGAFRQIMPLLAWRESLTKSFPLYKSVTEKLFLDCLLQMGVKKGKGFVSNIDVIVDKSELFPVPDIDLLEDHRDNEVITHWNKEESSWNSDSVQKETFQCELHWLKVRTYSIRAFVSLLKIHKLSNMDNTEMVDIISSSKSYLEKFEKCCEETRPLIVSKEASSTHHPFRHPENPHVDFFILKLNQVLLKLLRSLIDFCVNLKLMDSNSKLSPDLQSALETISESLKQIDPVLIKAKDEAPYVETRVIVRLQILLETYSLAALSLSTIEHCLSKSGLLRNRKSIQLILSDLSTTSEKFADLGSSFCSKLDILEENVASQSGASFLGQMKMINPLIIQSYKASIQQLRTLASSKCDYVKSLKF